MQEISPDNFKISCSAIHKIMGRVKTKAEKIAEMQADINTRTEKMNAIREGLKSKDNARAKIAELQTQLQKFIDSPDAIELPVGAKSFCQEWLKIQIYERKPEFSSKYTEKGNKTEQDAIELLNDFYGWNAEKNTSRVWGKYMHGEYDTKVEGEDLVVDIKCPFECWTFPIFETSIPDEKYELQIQGYMHLTGCKNGRVSYCLMDMPEDMIAKELRWKFPYPPTDEEYRAAAAQYIYSDMADNLRVKSFNFVYDPALIQAIENRVIECRAYIRSLLDNMQ